MHHHPHHHHPPGEAHERRSWAPLVLLAVAQAMVVLDITIVNVALPSIGAAFGVGTDDLQWVVTAYVLCSGGLLLVGGRAADLLGRRRAFLGGLLLFTAASLASGLAPSSEALVAARAVQGVGAAVLTPAALALVTTTYAGPQRATALTVWGAVASGGVAVGVVLGGMLTSWLSWEWVFLVNVPVGLAVVALAPRIVPDAAPVAASRSLDVTGAVTVVAGLAALVYGLSGAAEHGWGAARTLALLGVAVALFAAFAVRERAAANPLVPPATWRARSLSAGAVVMLGATGLMAGTFFLNSLYVQEVLGWSALRSGLSFLPFVAAIALGVHAAGHVVGHVGSRAAIAAGMGLAAAGALLLWLAPAQASYATDLLPGFLVLGAGMGLTFPAVQIAAMHDVDHARAGLASGVMMTAHEVGAALGVAVLAAVAAGASGLAAGYGDGFLVAAAAAAALAVGAAIGAPSVRPASGTPTACARSRA